MPDAVHDIPDNIRHIHILYNHPTKSSAEAYAKIHHSKSNILGISFIQFVPYEIRPRDITIQHLYIKKYIWYDTCIEIKWAHGTKQPLK